MIRQIVKQIQTAYMRWQARQDIAAVAGQIIQAGDDPAQIFDGISYALPVLLPDSLRDELAEAGTLDEFIRESYSQATAFQFDAPYKKDLPFNPPTENPLAEWDISTRRYILERCHAAYNRNPDAKVGINHIANFAIGDGFQLVTYHPDVEALLNEFIEHEDNRIREYERQVARDLLIDGEVVLRYVHDHDMGITSIVPYRPDELESIKTDLGNYRKIVSFFFNRTIDEGTVPGSRHKTDLFELSADEILFVAINNRAYELRGRSEIFPALPWLKARKDWLENRARINYWLSVIMWSVKVNAASSQIMASVASRWSTPPSPGSIAIEHASVEVEPMQASPNAPEASDDGRQLLMQVAKSFGLPEYFLGDGENANLASATRQQLPALVKFEDYQRTLVMELWKPMFRKVIQLAVDDGRLPAMVQKHDGAGNPIAGELIPTVKAFDVMYQDMMQDDILKLTQALEKQVQNGFTSVRSARSELGKDPDKIEKEIQDEREQEMNDIAQGRQPYPPMMRPDGLLPEEGEEPELVGEPNGG